MSRRLLVCEGETDKLVLSRLAARAISERKDRPDLEIVPAYGRGVIPRMLRALEARYGQSEIIVVVDSDGNPEKARAEFRAKADWKRHRLIVANPDVSAWVTNGVTSSKSGKIQALADEAEFPDIESKHPEFREFLDAIQ